MLSTISAPEQRLFLAAVASIAAHQVQSFVVEPEQRPLRALALVGLGIATNAFLGISTQPATQTRRGAIALTVGAGPAFGAFVGHLVPLVRTGEIAPASETAILNGGGGAFLVVLGAILLRHRMP